MSNYFKKLNWNFSFPSLHDKIKEISRGQFHTYSNVSNFFSVPVKRLVLEYPFNIIESVAKQHNLSIANAIYRTQFSQGFSIIHTDSFRYLPGDIPVTVAFSLNLPLENTTGATSRWYDFSNHPELTNEDAKFDSVNLKKFKTYNQTKIEEFLNYCVASLTMDGPVVFNTAVPHNVDGRAITDTRTILSVWFIDKQTNTPATWEQSKFLEEIIID